MSIINMNKQKGFIPPSAGFTFLELIVSMLILTMCLMIFLGMFAHGSLALKKSSQLSIAGLLAQSIMERTIYQNLDDIEANSLTQNMPGNQDGWINFPTDKKWVNKRWKDFKYKVETIDGSGELVNFKKVKITVKTPLGSELDLVGLKVSSGTRDGTMAYVVNDANGNSSIYILNLRDNLPQAIPVLTTHSGKIYQLEWDRLGRYIFYLDDTGLWRISSSGDALFQIVNSTPVGSWTGLRIHRFSVSQTEDKVAIDWANNSSGGTPVPITRFGCNRFNYDGGGDTLLATVAMDPKFSPDGSMAMTGYTCGWANNLYQIKSDGTVNVWLYNVVDFTTIISTDYGNSQSDLENVSWSPSGRYAALSFFAAHYYSSSNPAGTKYSDSKSFIVDTTIAPGTATYNNSHNRQDIASCEYLYYDNTISPDPNDPVCTAYYGSVALYRPIWISPSNSDADAKIVFADIDQVDASDSKHIKVLTTKLVAKDVNNLANPPTVLASGLSKELILRNNTWVQYRLTQHDYMYSLKYYRTNNVIVFGNGSGGIVYVNGNTPNQTPTSIVNGFCPVIYNKR